MSSLFPLVRFDPITRELANAALEAWGHRMGPQCRPQFEHDRCHGLFHDGLVAVTITSPLVRECVGGGLGHLTRANALELSRLCADSEGTVPGGAAAVARIRVSRTR